MVVRNALIYQTHKYIMLTHRPKRKHFAHGLRTTSINSVQNLGKSKMPNNTISLHQRTLLSKPKTKLKNARLQERHYEIATALIEVMNKKYANPSELLKALKQRLKQRGKLDPTEINVSTLRRAITTLKNHNIVK
jgi:hypothetical protein